MTTTETPAAPAPEPEQPKRRTAELQPLLASWLRSRQEFLDTVGGALHRGTHRSTWHGLRLPLYMARLALMSPRGLWRVARQVWHVMSDGEARPLRIAAVVDSDPDTYMRLRKARNERIRQRTIIAATLLGAAVLLAGLAVGLDAVGVISLPPTWTLWVLGFSVVQVLGWVGRPVGKPLVQSATVLAGSPGPLRAPFVMEALRSLRISGMTKDEDIGLLFDVARVGPGYQVDLELPRGVAAGTVMEKRAELSGALRRELGCVWPSVGKRHQGHLVLYIADEPMSTARQAKWPLLKDGSVNVFRPAPMFTDQRGRWVDLTLAYTTGVIGAVPRMGKTFALRELLLVAGLDPRTKVYSFDLKGTGDLSPTALFAYAYSVGDESEEIAEQVSHMRKLREEMRRRAKVVRALPYEECPDNKVTDALASRRDLGLEPIVVGVDECQVWFEYEDTALRKELIAICTDLVKRGPALGIICYFATQKPDANSIPTAIADNAVIRLCFKVLGWKSNDQVLGNSAHQMGLRATLFAFEDKGVAYFRGDGADAQIVRTVVGLDAPTSEKVAVRARQARLANNRLTGMAAGETMAAEADQARLVEDVRHVFEGAGAMHLGDIAEGLALLRQGIYGHLDNSALASMLRAAGVRVETVYVSGKARDEASAKGVKVEWLDVSTTEVIGDAEEAAAAENAD